MNIKKSYVEASPKARQLFFLYLIVWGAIVVAWEKYGGIPPHEGSGQELIVQIEELNFISLMITIVFYTILSAMILWIAVRTSRSGQWPPEGMAMPFRTRIKDVSPAKVWIYTISILCMYGGHIFLQVYSWWHINAVLETIPY